MMRVLVSGLGGFMGREVAKLCLSGYQGASLIGGVDINGCQDFPVPCVKGFSEVTEAADVVVDFSHHSATRELLGFARGKKLPLVLATTGQTREERALIEEASREIPLFFASNYSMGVALLCELAVKAAALMPEAEIEIIEKHHNRKVDAPSGTALTLARSLQALRENAVIKCGRAGDGKREKNEIGIQSVRLGNIVGEHEVLIGTANQTLSLKHEAHSRALFAEGALAAAEFLMGRPAGLYDMKAMIKI